MAAAITGNVLFVSMQRSQSRGRGTIVLPGHKVETDFSSDPPHCGCLSVNRRSLTELARGGVVWARLKCARSASMPREQNTTMQHKHTGDQLTLLLCFSTKLLLTKGCRAFAVRS